MQTIKINGKNYNIKNTIRSLFLFENITKKPFKIETIMDNYIFTFCVILASNPDTILTFEDFINATDNDFTLFEKITKAIEKESKKDNLPNLSTQQEDINTEDNDEQKKS